MPSQATVTESLPASSLSACGSVSCARTPLISVLQSRNGSPWPPGPLENPAPLPQPQVESAPTQAPGAVSEECNRTSCACSCCPESWSQRTGVADPWESQPPNKIQKPRPSSPCMSHHFPCRAAGFTTIELPSNPAHPSSHIQSNKDLQISLLYQDLEIISLHFHLTNINLFVPHTSLSLLT